MTANIEEPTFIHPLAKIGHNVLIGRFCHIGPNVTLNDGVKIMSHVVIDGHTTIEGGCVIYPFASIGTACQDLKFTGERTFVKIGHGTTIRESVTINSATGKDGSTLVGENCLIMAYSHVAHNCTVGDNVIMANSGTLAGHVSIDDYAIIGGLTAVHQFSHIGKFSIVGGCSKVVKDVPPFMMADGHPAKVRGLNSIGLRRHGFSKEARRDLKRAYKILFRSRFGIKHAIQKISQELPSNSKEIKHLLKFLKSSKRGISR